ncbi:hypothetical protein EVAR_50162_1 [Eumeta japonica]|uniref:Uncharacterized protein n=1 Tax=Eumeta variegata TaxID=151549 RepID=A0A4C1SFF6_EUMVA|nr:hypothetical protein EVAR_50162_1 [Eumeta japonica]
MEEAGKTPAEVASTREMLGQMHVPERLEEIRKVVTRPAPRYELRRSGGETQDGGRRREDPWPLYKTWYRTHPHRGFLENHTAEHVITKLRGVVDAREMGVAWTG